MTSAQEIRADGWQSDTGARNRTISVLAADLQRYRRQDTALRALVLSWRDRADACCSLAAADELRGCAAGVDSVMGTAARNGDITATEGSENKP